METIPEYSVGEISLAVKRCVETNFDLVRVKGEIFGAKKADSGHWYLSLKDQDAVLSAVCWKGVAMMLPLQIEDGIEVVATGKITTFSGRSSYQLVIEKLEMAGAGALLKLLEERKQKFLKEGLFDEHHKKNVPFLPDVIGVVTSASGAVIRDIIHRVRDRFPRRIIVWPTPVQGEGSAPKIAAAIRGFNQLSKNGAVPRPDVLIVARGGGSLEDLWPFNEEEVVRAVYDSEIPVISAVGHETDTMLIDYVADLRAPTPTGAAEFAVPVKAELEAEVLSLNLRYHNAIHHFLKERCNRLDGLKRGIPKLSDILADYRQRLDDKSERFKVAFQHYMVLKKNALLNVPLKKYYIENMINGRKINLKHLTARLDAVSVESVLKRGFAWVTDRHFQTVYDASNAKKKGELNIRFSDGIVKTRIAEKRDVRQFDLFSEETE